MSEPMSDAQRPTAALRPGDLRGRWSLVSWQQTYDDGRITYPMGEQPIGYIEYGEQEMSCMLARRNRPPFSTGGQWNASADEKAGAYDSFMSYSGSYEIEGDTVVHHVRMSLFPNWEGGVQRRRGRLVDGRLHLLARIEEGTPQARTAALIWERAAT
ncbi:MAG: lipocalin-like domain-containing protein [Burkholderiaceae bacterium]